MSDDDSAPPPVSNGSIHNAPFSHITTTTTTTHPSSTSSSMMKVIKGEIHNVWVVMRVSHSSEQARRFTEEVVLDEHPLVVKLKELHEVLSDYEQNNDNRTPISNVSFFLTPFCQAVVQADINASITGAALSALHKFLLYGFLNDSSSEGMKMIAESIMKCTFEETQTTTSSRLLHLSYSSMHPSSSVAAADEQVVLKLLNLGSMVVQSSIQQHSSDNKPLLNTELVVGILNTCLHVSHRAKHASLLLKSAAADALGQIVLCVFYNTNVEEWKEARTIILQQLSSSCNPQQHDDTTCITSLSLLNIALETMPYNSASNEDVEILQNDLCKYLLRLSTTQDLVILNLTLRVIFNLFQSIRNHLKVPLEIFLTSVHVRILESKQSSQEQREVVLESLLEFCREPALMQDLYLNYDCDVQCTNLFSVVASSLSKMAGDAQDDATKPLNVLNRLALEGILYIIDSIARRCRGSGDATITSPILTTTTLGRPKLTRSQSSFVSVEDLHSETSSHQGDNFNESYDDLSDRWRAEETHKVLQEQKRHKDLLEQATAEFNRPHPDFVEILQDLELTSTPATPEQVADFLYTTPHLDKTLIGLYLSKGPIEDYPFHEQVRKAFVALFDFSGKGFAEALRKLLSRFRLPGEAQCIDRLMEAFAQELYRQQQSVRHTEDLLNIEGDGDVTGKVEEEDDKDTSHPFKSADAVFTLAFSTILLNTDLHNPTIKDEKRMTLEQFIRNNRGINDGGDFPEEFLTELYGQIKSQEIQVRKELFDLVRRHAMEDYDGEIPAKHWAVVLSSKTKDVAKPFFTPVEEARRSDVQAGVHDKDMFLSICESAIHCVSSIFVRSSDDALVLKALKGFKQMAQICVYFDLDEPFDKILKILLGHGRDYVMSCIALEYAGYDGEQIMSSENSHSVYSRERQVPPSLVTALPATIEQRAEGSATHRGFLSLDCAFALIRKQPSKIREAWPTLIECLCALRDARALPDRVIFLDDFADSQGNLLPLSSFAKQSQKRLDGYYRSLSEGDHKKASDGWLSSVFKTKETNPYDTLSHDGGESSSSERNLSSFSQSLLEITRRARLEEVVLMRPKNVPMAKQTISALLDAIDVYPYFDDPIFEQHAVYSLELALLALISNRDRAGELFPMFLPKFEAVLKSRSEGNKDVDPNIPTPFLMERVVVTILRSSIHLYEVPEVRSDLFKSMKLILELPPTFMQKIADRISCGMAIFLSQKFAILSSTEEWKFMRDILGRLAHFGPARGFVFDGIANTVESQLAPSSQKDDHPAQLSAEGSMVLTKLLLQFVFGKFENDMALALPAMMCMENLYGHIVLLERASVEKVNGTDSPVELVPDKELWTNVAVAFYSVCRNSDPIISREGTDCFQRFIASTKVESLPDAKWIDILYLIANKQPLLEVHEPRINTCTILGKALLMTAGPLSLNKANWEDLTDIITQFAWVVGENLREGRKGRTLPLFEHTLHTVTFLSNHMVTTEFGGDPEFGQWASDTLLSELEKVGAGGGSLRNVAATSAGAGPPRSVTVTTKVNPLRAPSSAAKKAPAPGDETEDTATLDSSVP